MHKQVHSSFAPNAIGPYSQAIEYQRMVFCSGQLGIDPKTGQMASDEIKSQTKQVLENLNEVLKAAGSGLNKVVKTEVFLLDLADFDAFNQTYASFFPAPPYPARYTVQAAKLPKGARIEIGCTALKY